MRLKDVTEFCPAYAGAARKDTVAFVPMEALRYDSIAQQEIPFEEARGKYTFFADGDLLFAKVTPCFENGNIAVANNLKGSIGFGSSEIFVLRAKPGLNNRYLFYVVQASPFMDGGCATMCGVGGLKRMSPLFPRTFEWEIPSEKSQGKIVAYLDEKSAAIDARVAVLEKKLAAYKRLKASIINRAVTRGLNPKANLKDSGVDWIGKIPVGWDAVRVESHYDVQLGKMLSAKPSDASEIVLEYICAANVHYDGVSLNGLKQMWYLPREIETFRVKSGDLLVVEGGAGAGGCSVAENVDRIVCMQNSILRIRPTSTGSNRFLNYWFNDLGQRGYIGCACNVATIPHFTKEKMRQTPMPYPPSAEQIAIADYLDAECAKIDKMAELVTREIELYKKLKRSLINEVVTGKRPVFADKPLRRSKEVA